MTCLCLSCPFRTLLPFTCVDDSCLSLSVMHSGGRTHGLEFCGTVLLWVRLALSAFTPATASSLFFDLALCLVVSGHASTQTCAQGSTRLHVWWSPLALFLTRASRQAPFHRLAFTTVHRESLCLHLLLSKCSAPGFTLVD